MQPKVSFTRADGGSKTVQWSMEATKKWIAKTALLSTRQVKDVADALRRPTMHETLQAIHLWVQQNFKYKLDDDNREQIRTAARSWKDRAIGVDCEDYSIVTVAILGALGKGAKAKMAIVGFNGETGFQHIYPIYSDIAPGRYQGQVEGIALDRLLNFNEHPKNIRETMVIDLLSGLNTHDQAIAEWLKSLEPSQQLAAIEIIPYIQRITPMGAIIWRPNTPMTAINTMADQVEQGDLSGLGAFRRNSKKPDKRKPVSAVLRVTPMMVAGRAAYLLAVSQNLLKLASRYEAAMISPAEAEKRGWDAAEHQKWVARLPKMKKHWEGFGGDWSKLVDAVNKGKGKGKGFGFIDPGTLGVAAAAAAPIIGAAVPIFAGVDFTKMTGKAKDGNQIGGAEEIGKVAANGIKALREKIKANKDKKAQQAELEALNAAQGIGEEMAGGDPPSPNRSTEETGKSNTALYVVGGLVLAGAIAAAATMGGGGNKPKR